MELPLTPQHREGVTADASASSLRDVAAVEDLLGDMLRTAGLFDDVEVERSEDPDRLVSVRCRFAPEYDERDIAEIIEWMWLNRVGYPFWEAHSTCVDAFGVEFGGATRTSPIGDVVTVHLLALKVLIPAQRLPVD